MSKRGGRKLLRLGLMVSLLVMSGCVVSCHEKSPGGSVVPTGNTGSVTTSLSDPPTCSASIDHVWVTVTKVTANTSSTVGPADSGWVTLVDLTTNPQQIDLLDLGSGSCVLAQLGSATGLPAASYQQIRLFLLDNASTIGPSSNNCGFANGFNCVQPHFGEVQELLLSKEVQTGVVIAPSQLAGGSINLTAGKDIQVSITFDACASIILQAGGQYRLKPALHAGQIGTIGNSIRGTVMDSSNNNPIPGAVVLIEQPDSNAIDRVVDAAVTAGDGTFIFCPLPAGSYDVVAAAAPFAGATTVYSATIAFQVAVGTALGNIPLVSEGSGTQPTIPWATLTGQVTSLGSGGATAAADISLSPLQDATPTGGSLVHVTVPVFSSISQPMIITTVPAPVGGAVCPSGKNCFNYSLNVPSGNPSVGTFSGGSVTYALPLAGTAVYSLNAGSADCTTSNLNPATISSISVAPASAIQVSAVLNFSNCTQPY